MEEEKKMKLVMTGLLMISDVIRIAQALKRILNAGEDLPSAKTYV